MIKKNDDYITLHIQQVKNATRVVESINIPRCLLDGNKAQISDLLLNTSEGAIDRLIDQVENTIKGQDGKPNSAPLYQSLYASGAVHLSHRRKAANQFCDEVNVGTKELGSYHEVKGFLNKVSDRLETFKGIIQDVRQSTDIQGDSMDNNLVSISETIEDRYKHRDVGVQANKSVNKMLFQVMSGKVSQEPSANQKITIPSLPKMDVSDYEDLSVDDISFAPA